MPKLYLYNRKTIAELITRAIETEDPQKPYTDREITRIVKDAGEDCSLSCILYLRQQLGFPPSGKRKINKMQGVK